MVSPCEITSLDPLLTRQLRLALASPLWKTLPYGVEPNPRLWRCKVITARPERRFCLEIQAPWRREYYPHPAQEFILDIRHSRLHDCVDRLHQRLCRLNELVRQAENDNRMGLPEPLFYDALARALVYPRLPDGARLSEGDAALAKEFVTSGAPLRFNWGRHLRQHGLDWLHDSLRHFFRAPAELDPNATNAPISRRAVWPGRPVQTQFGSAF